MRSNRPLFADTNSVICKMIAGEKPPSDEGGVTK